MRLERLSSKKGFTMVELVVVITILAILSVIGTQQIGNILQKSRATADLKNAEVIAHSLEQAIAAERISLVTPGTGVLADIAEQVLDDSVGASANLTTTSLSGVLKGYGKITDPATNTTYSVSAGTAYLGTLPKPKAATSNNFYAKITKNGVVTILSGTGIGTGQVLYPKPASFPAGAYEALN